MAHDLVAAHSAAEWMRIAVERAELGHRNVLVADRHGRCSYVTQPGSPGPCFIGAGVPEAARPRLPANGQGEEAGAWMLVDLGALAVDGMCADEGGQLLAEIQEVHDTVHPDRWISELRTIAEDWGIDL